VAQGVTTRAGTGYGAYASSGPGLAPRSRRWRRRGARCPPERLQRALTVLEVAHDIEVYPGSGHRFMTEMSGPAAALARFTRMRYLAADAWRRIYAFFGEHIGG